MTAGTQLPCRALAWVPLQPVAHVDSRLEDLAPRLGVEPERYVDDLGSLAVALKVNGYRYLLRSFDDAPTRGTEIHCADPGDPVDQLRRLLELVDFRAELTHWWDGTVWHDEPLDPAA
jgi:hypothetical protein